MEWLHTWGLQHTWSYKMVGNGVLVLRKSRYRFWVLKVQNGQRRMRILAPEIAKKTVFLGNFSAVYVRNDFKLGVESI